MGKVVSKSPYKKRELCGWSSWKRVHCVKSRARWDFPANAGCSEWQWKNHTREQTATVAKAMRRWKAGQEFFFALQGRTLPCSLRSAQLKWKGWAGCKTVSSSTTLKRVQKIYDVFNKGSVINNKPAKPKKIKVYTSLKSIISYTLCF